MRQYKRQLQILSKVGGQSSGPYTVSIDAFLGMFSAMQVWHHAINGISVAQLEEECSYDRDVKAKEAAESELQRALKQSVNAWEKAKEAMRRFSVASDGDLFRKADMLYRASKSWADDVFDGLWPSSHCGADDHNDVWECVEGLLDCASKNFGIDDEELWALMSREWHESSTRLGGSGKRF